MIPDWAWPLLAAGLLLLLGWIDSRRITRRVRTNADIDTLSRQRVGYAERDR